MLAVIWARDERERESHCIIQRGREMMHHLCPYPSGPVRMDPQPLTFPDTLGVFHPPCRAGCVSVQPCGCFVFLCVMSMSQPAARKPFHRITKCRSDRRNFFFFFGLSYFVTQIKGQAFLPECLMFLALNTRRRYIM